MSKVNKYQFCIRFSSIDRNSAASKAVLDCNQLLSELGYVDFTMTVKNNSNKKVYYFHLIKELLRFILSVKPNSVIAIQYPLLSINSIFKKIIKVLRFKNVKFFCIVHDLESLRTGGEDNTLIKKEIDNLQSYDSVIVHNTKMLEWLRSNGFTGSMTLLELFDYLGPITTLNQQSIDLPIVYAGNLAKSKFIEQLAQVKHNNFDLYGPGLSKDTVFDKNMRWQGEFSPAEVMKRLKGKFGLIWDGGSIYHIDGPLGRYLEYNNPHKASLYIAAGMPLIAPRNSAIGDFIIRHKIGILVESLKELETINVDDHMYVSMQERVYFIRDKVLKGDFFKQAVKATEAKL